MQNEYKYHGPMALMKMIHKLIKITVPLPNIEKLWCPTHISGFFVYIDRKMQRYFFLSMHSFLFIFINN